MSLQQPFLVWLHPLYSVIVFKPAGGSLIGLEIQCFLPMQRADLGTSWISNRAGFIKVVWDGTWANTCHEVPTARCEDFSRLHWTPKHCISFRWPQNPHILPAYQHVFQILAKGWSSRYSTSLRTFWPPSRLPITADVANNMPNRRRLLSPLNLPQAKLVNLTVSSFLGVSEMALLQRHTCQISYVPCNQPTGRCLP